jgi:hypothetical protein
VRTFSINHRPAVVLLGGLVAAVAAVVLTVAVLNATRAEGSSAPHGFSLLGGEATGLGSFAKGTSASGAFIKQSGIAPEDVHRAAVSATGWKMWLGVSDKAACLYYAPPGADGPGVVCAPVADAAAGRLAVTVTGAGKNPSVTVLGVVPDGIQRVSVAAKAGRTVSDVANNAFIVTTDATATDYAFVRPDGSRAEYALRVEK